MSEADKDLLRGSLFKPTSPFYGEQLQFTFPEPVVKTAKVLDTKKLLIILNDALDAVDANESDENMASPLILDAINLVEDNGV